ncbi:MAG: hypothetical protein FK733_04870 [Asgard group archaeon]|nr:hypothetical protein [Asgard group archaeon]
MTEESQETLGVFKIYGIIQSVGDFHDELDILEIKVNETHVIMTFEKSPIIGNRTYFVRIYWDDNVENGAWGYNRTDCFLVGNYTFIQLFDNNNDVIFEEPFDMGVTRIDENSIIWQINTSMLSSFREPVKVYGFSQYQETIQIYPEILSNETWTDYYPNDQYRYFNTKQLYWLIMMTPVIAISIFIIIKNRKNKV